MVFELITGDYLFDPKSGDKYAKEEDHIAYIIELIGHPDLKWLEQGKRFRKWFTTKGRMKRIYKHKIWKLHEIFIDKYSFKKEEAEQLSDFLMQALQWRNEDRKSAQEMLEHPWLSMPADYNYREESDGEGEGSDNEEDDDEEDTPAKDTNKDDDDKSWVTVSSDDESDEASNSSDFELVDHP
jgi:serine/threonine-protein kinase SRPK3